MYPKQKAAIFCKERYSIVEASTKSGKTVGCMVWLAEQAIKGGANRNYWWVAPIYSQAEIAYRRLKAGLGQNTVTIFMQLLLTKLHVVKKMYGTLYGLQLPLRKLQ